MPALDRSVDLSFWSEDMRAAVRRRVREAGGVALITLAATMAISLATWSVQDPSFSHATDAPVRNLLGGAGAVGSDLVMQLFGLASTVLVLPVAIWGWRIAIHRPVDRQWPRLACWVAGVVLASGFASCLPNTHAWPLPTGLGGVIGDAVLRLPTFLFGASNGFVLTITALLLAVGALFAIGVAAGFGWHDARAPERRTTAALKAQAKKPPVEEFDDDEDEDDDRAPNRFAVSLGWMVHEFLSLKARAMRLIGQRMVLRDVGERIQPAVGRERIEPRMSQRGICAAQGRGAR